MLPEPGQSVGPYVVEAVLGSGGMGAVLRARHGATGAVHALKVILPGRAGSPQIVSRFRREAEALGRLPPHPGIVAVHASGTDAGRMWCAMELVEGGPLTDRLRQGPLEPTEVVALAAAIARALDHAHTHGVIHRDLKPDNVVIDPAGAPHLIDFGLARLVDEDSGLAVTELTKTGQMLGTPAYMAPEQADAGAETPTPATDVYGLGAVLHAMLTGEPPFGGRPIHAMIAAILFEDVAPPSRRRPEIPPELDAICLKALEKDPARRYPSAGAMADDLERWRAGEPTEARPPSLLGRLWRRLRPRTRARRTAGALLASALVFAGAALLVRAVVAPPLPNEVLAAIERRVDADHVVRPHEATAAAAIAAELEADTRLDRRATLLACLAESGRRDADLALAALVRIDDGDGGTTIDGDLLSRAARVLAKAGRTDVLHRVLYGAEPEALMTEDLTGSIDLRFLAPLAREVAAGARPLPRGSGARRDLARALNRAGERGLALALETRAVEERIREAERLPPEERRAARLEAWETLRHRFQDFGVTPERRLLADSFVGWVQERFIVEATTPDLRVRDARATLDILVRILHAGRDLVAWERRVEVVDFRSDLIVDVVAESGRRAARERLLVLSAWLLVQGIDRMGTLTNSTMSGILEPESESMAEIVSIFDPAGLVATAAEERARPANRRNPAMLLAIAELQMQRFEHGAVPSEVGQEALACVESALETDLPAVWLWARAARHYGHYSAAPPWPRPLEVAERAVELERAMGAEGVADENRIPLAHDRLARTLLKTRMWIRSDMIENAPPLEEPRLSPRRALQAARTALALLRRIPEERWRGQDELRPRLWTRIRNAIELAGRLGEEAYLLAEEGPPACCDGEPPERDGSDSLVEDLASIGLELELPPFESRTGAIIGRQQTADLHRARARHALAHGDEPRALELVEPAIAIYRQIADDGHTSGFHRLAQVEEDIRAPALEQLGRPEDARRARAGARAHRADVERLRRQ